MQVVFQSHGQQALLSIGLNQLARSGICRGLESLNTLQQPKWLLLAPNFLSQRVPPTYFLIQSLSIYIHQLINSSIQLSHLSTIHRHLPTTDNPSIYLLIPCPSICPSSHPSIHPI